MTNQEAIMKLKTYVDTIHKFPALLGTLSENKSVKESLEVYELSIKAMEKQEAMEPKDSGHNHDIIPSGFCPMCGTLVNQMERYCHGCGQALEWRIVEGE